MLGEAGLAGPLRRLGQGDGQEYAYMTSQGRVNHIIQGTAVVGWQSDKWFAGGGLCMDGAAKRSYGRRAEVLHVFCCCMCQLRVGN